MDEYGYAAAAKAGLRVFVLTTRRTGKTEWMLGAVRDGDRIITTTMQEAARLRSELRDRRMTGVTVLVWDPESMRGKGRISGRTFFDDSWHLAFVEREMERMERERDFIMSAFGSSEEVDAQAERWDVNSKKVRT